MQTFSQLDVIPAQAGIHCGRSGIFLMMRGQLQTMQKFDRYGLEVKAG
jgi:hypothetical protein